MIATQVYRSPATQNHYYLCDHHARIAASKGWARAGKLTLGEDECEACDERVEQLRWRARQ